MSSFIITSGTDTQVVSGTTTDKKGFATVALGVAASFGSTSDVSVLQMHVTESYDTATLVVSGRLMYVDIGGVFSELNIRGYSFPFASFSNVLLNRYSVAITEAQYDDLFNTTETVYIDESVPTGATPKTPTGIIIRGNSYQPIVTKKQSIIKR